MWMWWGVVGWVQARAGRPCQCDARYKRKFVSDALSSGNMLVFYDWGYY